MTQSEKKQVVKRLAQFKIDYGFTSKQLAKMLQTTESAVSNWFNDNSIPRKEKVENIYKLFNKYCIPGIIRLPKNNHWPTSIFIRVDDIKNPYGSWIDDEWTGEEPKTFTQWVKDWEKQFPNPVIYRQYTPDATSRAKCHLDLLNLNTTIEFRNYFINSNSWEEVLSKYRGFAIRNIDPELAESLMRGDDDGTT